MMFRLIIALGVATALWPVGVITKSEVSNQQVGVIPQSEVTPFDALSAVQSLYSDVTSFCDRNEETCKTTKSLASSAVNSIKGGLNNLANENNQTDPILNVDETKTGSTAK